MMREKAVRRARARRFTGMLFATLFLCLGASAQRVDESIEVSIVNVDVQVTDKRGNRVTGLRAEDFVVHDGGRPQPITNFSEYGPSTSPATASIEGGPAAPSAARAPRPRRSVVLFIEPVTLANFRARELFGSIRGLLHGTVAKGDQVSIVTFTRAMRLREPFTDDIRVIDVALKKLEDEMSGVEGTPIDESAWQLSEAESFEKEYEAALAALGLGARESTAASMSAVAAARRQRFLIRQKAAALESLMQSISGADGRKIVIMATRRFGLYAGAEYFDGAVPGQYRQELDTSAYRDSLIRMANAHGITIYPIHPEGLRSEADNDPAVRGHDRMESTLDEDMARMSLNNSILLNETAALEELADATGGLSAWGSTGIAKILPRVAEDLESYYSIGYRTPVTRRDATRAIVVKTKNPEYVVRARRQFVEKSDVTQMKERVVANLFQKVGGSSAPIPFDASIGAIRKNGRNRWSVPLKVRVPIGALTMLPSVTEHSGEFSVYVATGGVLGVMSEVDRKSQTFRIPASDLARARGSHFTYAFDLELDQLANRLSIGVMDEVGREFELKRYTLPGVASRK